MHQLVSSAQIYFQLVYTKFQPAKVDYFIIRICIIKSNIACHILVTSLLQLTELFLRRQSDVLRLTNAKSRYKYRLDGIDIDMVSIGETRDLPKFVTSYRFGEAATEIVENMPRPRLPFVAEGQEAWEPYCTVLYKAESGVT